jgi:hypothetical protein
MRSPRALSSCPPISGLRCSASLHDIWGHVTAGYGEAIRRFGPPDRNLWFILGALSKRKATATAIFPPELRSHSSGASLLGTDGTYGRRNLQVLERRRA